MATQDVQRSVDATRLFIIIGACLTLLMWSGSSFAQLQATFDGQDPLNPVPIGVPVTYTVTAENTDTQNGAIGYGVGIYVDGVRQAANAGGFTSTGCIVDALFPTFWACGQLSSSFPQETLTFTWLSPDAGQHEIQFEVFGQRPIDNDFPDFFFNLFTDTNIGNSPPVLNPIGDQFVTELATLDVVVTASDPDPNDILTFAAQGLPSFCTFGLNPVNALQTLSCSPGTGDAGAYPITITVTDSGGLPPPLSDSETFTFTVNPAAAPTISITAPTVVDDTDSQPGENVQVSGSATDSTGAALPSTSFRWFVNGSEVTSASGQASPTLTLPDGNNSVELEATDSNSLSARAGVSITVNPANNPPDVTITAPASVSDTDNQPGEAVQVTGAATDAEDGVLPPTTFRWFVNGSEVTAAAGQASPTLSLPIDGDNTIELEATDSDNLSSRASATVTVGPPVAAPTVSVIAAGSTGVAISVDDTDGLAGETIQVTGSATDPQDGDLPPDSFRWFVNGTEVTEAAGQATATLTLNDGDNTIEFEATDSDNNATRASVTVSVAEPAILTDGPISGRPGLSPNETETAVGLETSCENILSISNPTQEQLDLLALCSTLASDTSSDADVADTLNAISGEQVTSQQATSIDFASVQLSNVGSRISALRTLGLRGSRGVSTAGLNMNISVDGKPVPVYAVAEVVKGLLRGGGASADEAQTDGQTDTSSSSILNPKLGIFINGNIAFGDKDPTTNETGFDFDSTGLTFGMDYLFTDHFVAGIALGYANAEAKFFGDVGEQSSDFYSGTVFGTIMHDKWFVAGIGGIANGDYDTIRRISGPLLSQDEVASGTTDGNNLFGGLSAEFNFGRGHWRFGPAVAINYIEADIDGFAETGAGALDLVYGDQTAKSLTAKAGLRLGYVFTTGFGVLSLDGRGDFVREYENDSQIIRVNFVNDPFVNDPSQPSPGFTVLTDEPDKDYGLWGLSLSYQGPHSISGFVDYQSVTGMSGMTLSEITVGLRIQKQFD